MMRAKTAHFKIEDFGMLPPHEAQARFLRSDVLSLMFLGGRGSGKSYAGCMKALLYCLRPEHAGLDYGVFSPTYRQLIRVQLPTILQFCEEFQKNAGFSLIKRHYRSDYVIEFINGSRMYLQSLENRGVDRVRSLSLSGAMIDEIAFLKNPWYAYQTILAAVRGGGLGQVCCTTTPRGYRGVVRRFVDAARNEEEGFQLIISTSQDNPHISKAFSDRMKATMSSAMWLQETQAKILRHTASVFNISRNVHVVPYVHNPHTTPYSIGIDPGYSHPAVVFVAHLREEGTHNRDIVFDELTPDEMPEDVLLKIMDKKIQSLGRMPEIIASDRALPQFNQKMMRRWTSVKVKTRQSKTDQQVWTGIQNLQGLLSPAEGPPRLFFAESLLKTENRGVISCFEQLRRKESQEGFVDAAIKDNRNDHSVDAVSYLMSAIYGRRGFGSDHNKPSKEDKYNKRLKAFGKAY